MKKYKHLRFVIDRWISYRLLDVSLVFSNAALKISEKYRKDD